MKYLRHYNAELLEQPLREQLMQLSPKSLAEYGEMAARVYMDEIERRSQTEQKGE